MSKLCPSYRCTEDAVLFGIVQPDATVTLMARPFTVTRDFVEAAAAGRQPETRFRFAGACVEASCAQWKRGQCGIPGRVRKALAGSKLPQAAPACAVRTNCRWFARSPLPRAGSVRW